MHGLQSSKETVTKYQMSGNEESMAPVDYTQTFYQTDGYTMVWLMWQLRKKIYFLFMAVS